MVYVDFFVVVEAHRAFLHTRVAALTSAPGPPGGVGGGAVVALRVLLFKNTFLAGNVAPSCSEFSSGQPRAQTPPGWVFGWPGGPEFAPLPPCRKQKCVVEGGFTQSSGWMGWCSGQEGGRLRHWRRGAGESTLGSRPCRRLGESPVCLREDLWADVGPGEPRDGPRGEEASGEPGACQPALLPSPPGHLMAPPGSGRSGPLVGELRWTALLSRKFPLVWSHGRCAEPSQECPGAGLLAADAGPSVCVPRPLPTTESTLGRKSSFGNGSAWGSLASPPTTSTARAASSSSRPATASSTVGTGARTASW